MDETEAKLLLRSFAGRLSKPNSGNYWELPGGRLSAEELEAIRFFCGDPAQELDFGSEPPSEGSDTLSLCLDAFDRQGPPEATLRLCLDFGTAMSKAWATGRAERETLPLVLTKDLSGEPVLAVPSSIFIGNDGHIFVGHAAERQHREHIGIGRRRFDNIKRLLSEVPVGSDIYNLPVDPAIDPTASGLTKGDLLVLYMAWLTDLSLLALKEAATLSGTDFVGAGDIRAVARRYAIPCFESADDDHQPQQRAEWARGAMSDVLLRAQILADTLSGRWERLEAKSLRQAHEAAARA